METTGESRSAKAASYQAQITGKSGGIFLLDGVKFDGYDNGVLMEAKGPGYANFIKNGESRKWFQGRNGLIDQARQQLMVAQGIPLEWHVTKTTTVNEISKLLPAKVLSLGERGVFIILTKESFSVHNPAHVELAGQVAIILDKAGLFEPMKRKTLPGR